MYIKKLLLSIFDFIFNERVIYWLVSFYIKHMKLKIKNAYGRFIVNRISNKGVGCHIYGDAIIHDSENLQLGDYVRIGGGAFLFCTGGISIGDNTQISRNVVIYSANHNVNGESIPYDDSYICKNVEIGRSVWIGMNVVITPGVSIGDGAIIGMGTVVSKNVPAGAFVVGAQQRIIKYRNMDEFYTKDKKEQWFGKIY
ncbi:DapH/DapD/GlmU-related protein [Sulfurovum sp.]|uniref:acyltransferase n=1 Tax=Sulfurovum sp. TaxID=1969726 RepID=UPI0035632DA7